MARAKSTFNPGGYSHWGVIRTLREAENAARWSPWSTIQWMEEARDQISLERPYYDEFDRVANKINDLWKSLERQRWYSAREFWKRGTIVHPPQRIKLFDEGFEPVKATSIHDLFKF